MLIETARNLLVGRIEAQRQVGGQHGRAAFLVGIEGVGNGFADVFRHPLVRAGRALGQLPFVFEQVAEEVVVPLGRGGGPGDFQAAGDGVFANAGAEGAVPAEALRLQPGGFRIGADVRRRAGAVGLAEGVAAGDQRHGFFVVHRHAGEGFTDVTCGGHRIGIAVRAFRVDVDQAHLHCRQRVLQIAVARVAAVWPAAQFQPDLLRTPVDIVRLPGVGAAAGIAEGFEAHRFQRHVAGQDNQVGPGEVAAVFLFDWPQQATRLVEADVVRPAVERGEALLAFARAAAAVADAVGAGAVPGHADEQAAVVAEVCRPPFLRVGHQGVQILFDRRQIETVEGIGVVEVFIHRIGQGGMLVQRFQAELIRPPILIGGAVLRCGLLAARKRAFAFSCHNALSASIKVLQPPGVERLTRHAGKACVGCCAK